MTSLRAELMRWLATLCGVRARHAARAPGASPDPNSAKAESYVTSNGAEKQKEQVLAVTVTSIEDASPNVKLVTLRVHAREAFSFRPGQWVDFYAPGVEKPGGYSIASSPGSFARDGTFVLAVRASRSSACGHWVHERCKKGDEARVRVGGKFFASREDLAHPLLLVAGGIGIAPLVGMLQTLVEEQRLESRDTREKDTKDTESAELSELSPRAILLCSTKNPATQPMAGEVRAVAAKAGGAVRVVFHRTDGERTGDTLCAETKTNHLHVSTENGRVDVKALREALRVVAFRGGDGESAKKKPPLAFLCGPPAMSDAAEAALLELGVPKEDVRLERWW